ncbi:MAG: translocation/assembly module TamB domain-containing protein, partial [Methylovulum sp.]
AIKKLELKSKTGQFQLTGDVSWKDSPAFDLIATGQNFNPAILSPEMPGNLTFSTHVKGKMAAALQLDAEIKELSGQLRGHPVSANGKLALNDEQLKVDALRIASGPNKLAIDGTLGRQQAALKLVMDMPNLATLWPNLGGNLQGEGQFQGEWKSPTVKFAATGNRLRFAEYSVKQLAINIDYHPETQKNSTIKLTANTIKSGSTELSKLSIEGEGSTVKHQFTVDMRSMQGDLSAALSGSLKTNNWQGAFSELGISSKEAGAWRLKDAMGIRVTQKAPGFDVTIDEGCLTQQAAAICVQGLYAADGNLKFALKTTAIPVRLVKAWLPESVDLTTVINGDAEIQQQKGFLSGRYQFAMPPGIILLKTKDTTKEIALGASSLSGDIKGDVVSGNIDLNLSGQDYLHGQLQMNIGKTQALSGQMSARVDGFAVLKAFVPQLTDIKGHLLANLTIKGSAKDPAISGQIDLTEGLVDTNQINLRDITIHALALEDNRIQVQGSIAPKFFKPETSEPLAIKGIISIDGEVQQQKSGLDGRYRLTIPTKMSITVKSQEIVLGPSLLSGNINGDLITADLDVRLVDQDYCRGNLQINTGDSQSLSGRFNASIRNFDLLETFVPQLSDIKGQLTADLNVGGTLQKPQVNGSAQLGKGAVDVVNMGVSVRDINFQALASADHPERILIKGGAKSGEGSLKLDGVVDLQAQPNGLADLFLAGDNFEVAKIPEAQIAISPALKIVFADGKGKISGTVKVPKALLVLQEIPENAVNVSDDEVIIGQTIDKEKQASSGGIDTDIEIELGKQVNFSGQGLKTDLAGRLKITDAAGKLTMNGNVDLVKASYKRFGQDLTVRKGRFLFNGPADNPWLDVEAIRLSKSKKVTAVLSLTGSLKNPKTLIFSEPALPETEALAYLITGGPLSQVGKSDGGMVASAALSYGTGQASWLAKKFGIDEFNLEEGETLEDSLLAVGQYLTPNFYIGTKVGLFNKQAVLVLKHKINETFNVETQTGSSQRIKLNYEFDTD